MKQGSSRVGFYSLVMCLNIFVAAMFIVITTPLPTPAPTPVVQVAPRQIAPAISGTPTRIQIPSLGLDLAIETGSYNPETGDWMLGTEKAYYANTSVPANDNNGVTLLYGHAQTQIFANLVNLKQGAQATVYTDNGRVFYYRYHSVKNVEPTDTSVFRIDGAPTLVLQTCTGAWDAYRAMYSFDFMKETKA